MALSAKRKAILKTCAIIVVAGGVAGSSVFYVVNKSKQKQEETFNNMISEKDKIISLYTSAVTNAYVVKRDIAAGETIGEADVELKALPNINSPSDLLNDPANVIGSVSKLPLKTNTALTSGMLYKPAELKDDLRRAEYNYIRLPLMLKKTDIIEIEIVFPNGASYSVVPKTKLTALDLTNGLLFMNADQETRFLMDAAWVDMVVNNAEVRAIQYVDGETQKADTVDYMPNKAIISLLKRSPELVETAKLRYTAGESVRGILEEELRALFPANEYKRFGAELPEGSYVSQRNGKSGANIVVVNPDATNQQGQGSGDVKDQVPGAGQTPDGAGQVKTGTVDYVDTGLDPSSSSTVDDTPEISTDPQKTAGDQPPANTVTNAPEIGDQ